MAEALEKPLNFTIANHNKQRPLDLVLCSCRGASTGNFAKRLSYLQKKTVHAVVLENIAQ
jgi:hypothetical protein